MQLPARYAAPALHEFCRRALEALGVPGEMVDLPPGVTGDSLARSPRAIAALPEPLHSAAAGALSASITTVFAVAAVVMVGGFVISIRMRELPLRDLAAMTTPPIVEPA